MSGLAGSARTRSFIDSDVSINLLSLSKLLCDVSYVPISASDGFLEISGRHPLGPPLRVKLTLFITSCVEARALQTSSKLPCAGKRKQGGTNIDHDGNAYQASFGTGLIHRKLVSQVVACRYQCRSMEADARQVLAKQTHRQQSDIIETQMKVGMV